MSANKSGRSLIVVNLRVCLAFTCICFMVCNGCTSDEECHYPDVSGLATPTDAIIRGNQPVRITCFVNCTTAVPGSRLSPVLFLKVKRDCYQSHNTHGALEGVLEGIINEYDGPTIRNICEDDIQEDSFSYTFTTIGNHSDVRASCGLSQPNCSPLPENMTIILGKYEPKIWSEQINTDPVIVVEEGNNTTVTCEKPANETTRVYWIFKFKDMENETEIFFNDSETVELNNGLILSLQIQESLSNESGLQSYSLSILNLTPNFSGTKVKCVISWEEGNSTECKPLEQYAVIIVTCLSRENTRVFSNQAKYTFANEGDNVTISCQKSTGTLAEWFFEFPDGMSLSYTNNKSTLIEMGLRFHNPTSTVEDLETFSVTFINTTSKAFNNTKIVCAALPATTTGSIVTNNTFEDVLLIKEANTCEVSSRLTEKELVIVISVPTGVVIALLVLILVIILIIMCVCCTSKNSK